MSLARALYTALVYALLPFAVARLYWRARREPAYREHLAERFGRYADARPARPVIWVHAVSVGETRAAEPLVRELSSRYADHDVVMTHMTPTGRLTGAELFGGNVRQCYLPYDYPAAVSRFLDHYRPRAGVLLETEVWPNVVQACRARGVPLCLANARLSAKSLRGYLWWRSLSRETFGALSAVAAQTEADAQRLRQLGAQRVTVTGNLKFEVSPPSGQLELGREWRASLGPRAVLLAASTRDGEEALILDALPRLPDGVLLVIVPRHPRRFDEVATLLENRGIAYARRTSGMPPAKAMRVLLGDSLGEMFAYYAACDVAFVGGSLLPFGSQNLIEACAAGKPVLIGPSTYNFAEAAERAIAAGAALQVSTANELIDRAGALLADSQARARMGERALEFSRAHQGATQRVLRLIVTPAEAGGPGGAGFRPSPE
ncbi:MAG TPA: lipid IV(A) 3-deoxy-D-manno-octulosonic acid transferase [Burkholderiales bacterium]|nr:lipid IV(A) 3-deoxy-D-manno-octulosonic acid transferase [Burkholderiales bacterium]